MDREDSEEGTGLLRAHSGHSSTELCGKGDGQEEGSWPTETFS